MAKIKVHELAGEMGVDKKALISYLTEKGYSAMTAVSAVPDAEVENIRARFGSKSAQVSAEVPKKAEAEASPAKSQNAGESAPRKKGTFRLFRKQNTSETLQKRQQPEAPKTAEPPEAPVEVAVKAALPETVAAAPELAQNAAPAEAAAVSDAVVKAEETKPAAEPPKEPAAADPVSDAKPEEPKEKKPEAPKEKKPDSQKEKRPDSAKDKNTQQPKKTAEAQKPAEAPAKDTGAAAVQQRPQIGVPIRRYATLSPDAYVQAAAQRNAAARGGSGDRNPRMNGRSGQSGSRQTFGQNAQRSARPDNRSGFGQRTGGQGGSQRGGFQGAGGQSRSGAGSGRAAFGQGQNQGTGRQGFGGGNGAMRGQRPMSGARPGDGDGALAHKTSRDYQGGKSYDKNREERRENGRRGDQENRQGQGRRQFNYVPRALQQKGHGTGAAVEKEVVTEIRLPERITIRDLAEKMKIPAPQLVKELFLKGMLVTVNHEINFELAQEIALAHEIIAEPEEKEDIIGELLAEGFATQVAGDDLTCGVDEQRRRDGVDAISGGGDGLPELQVGEVHPVQFLFLDGFHPRLLGAVEGKADNVEAFRMILVVVSLYVRHLLHAGTTPRSPEVDEHIVAFAHVFAKLVRISVNVVLLDVDELLSHDGLLLLFVGDVLFQTGE